MILPKLKNKKVIIGISGGIAAYKIPYLIRAFIKAGAEVKVVVTRNALELVSRVTLETLSKNRVYLEVFGAENDYTTEHISLTDWGDILVVAPATANIIGKYASGIADDALSTTLLAFNKQVIVVPAMNCKMFDHFAVQKNIQFLKQNGVLFIEPAFGELACGYEGKGRMAEPEEIFEFTALSLLRSTEFENCKILVTASRTEEALDPVRYVSNRSSGKTGFAIANNLFLRGAEVILVAGPSSEKVLPGIMRIDVQSAAEMYEAVNSQFSSCRAAVMAAAVADYTFPATDQKIKKSDETISFTAYKTTDILAAMGKLKRNDQILAGFALETENLIANGQSKLERKNLDFIVLNQSSAANPAFGVQDNEVSILDKGGTLQCYPKLDKEQIAAIICDKLLAEIKNQALLTAN